jgi:hypothetical protein
VTPVFVERYMLSSFVPFFFFAAAGIAVLSSSYGERIAGSVLLLTIALSVGHILAYRRKPHGAEWSRATAVAAANLKNNDAIAVAPPFAVNVVRYYASENRRPRIVPLPEASARSASIAVCATQHPSDCDQLRRDYGRVIASFRGVEVRAR